MNAPTAPTRVQIPACTDRSMTDDRYGDLIRIVKQRARNDAKSISVEIAHVRLDKSGKVMRFILADCEIVS
jgi:hypothetical protein